MKTLLVLRHGKSSWANANQSDHERPLKPRGERDARRMGWELKQRGVVPDLILSSTAERARLTAYLAADAAGCTDVVTESRELYLTGVAHQLGILASAAGEDVTAAMLVGHNPTLEDLSSRLSDSDLRLTTGNLVCIDLDIASWSELPEARGTLRFLLRPRELPPQEA
ncbi:MAG: histidine phosphatase family protein [Acidobacteriota bacterium]